MSAKQCKRARKAAAELRQYFTPQRLMERVPVLMRGGKKAKRDVRALLVEDLRERQQGSMGTPSMGSEVEGRESTSKAQEEFQQLPQEASSS